MSAEVVRQTKNAEVGHLAERHAAKWRSVLALVPDHPTGDVPSQNYLDGVLLQSVDTVMGVTVSERGTPVEVKAALFRKADGNSSRRGDVHIRRHAHDWLLERDGEYIVVVHDGVQEGDLVVLATRMVRARTVEAVITTWCHDGHYFDEVARIPWSRLMDPDRVERSGVTDER